MKGLKAAAINTRPLARNGLCWALLAAALLVAGCAHQKPVIYPRSDAPQGTPGKQKAVEMCMERAEAYGLDYSDGDVARRTAESGAVGGAGGAVAGAIYGDWARGAVAGVASGATVGLLRGLFAADAPAPVFRNFVARCLAERGYEVIGWQ